MGGFGGGGVYRSLYVQRNANPISLSLSNHKTLLERSLPTVAGDEGTSVEFAPWGFANANRRGVKRGLDLSCDVLTRRHMRVSTRVSEDTLILREDGVLL